MENSHLVIFGEIWPKGLHTLGNLLLATKQHVAKNRTSFYFWQHVAYKIKVTTKLPATCCLVYGGLNTLYYSTVTLARFWSNFKNS